MRHVRADSRSVEQKTELEGEMGSHSCRHPHSCLGSGWNEYLVNSGQNAVGNPLDDICRPFHPTTKIDLFLSSVHGPFSKKDHILGH